MKTKISLFLAFISMIGLQSCTVNDNTDNIDNDTIAEVFELKNVNFGYDNDFNYSIYQTLDPQIYPGDVVLVYRLSGTINSSTPIWQQIPRTFYLEQGELDYDFDFSQQDFTIYARGTYALISTPTYINNETFRLVIVPGNLPNKTSQSVDYSNYNAVIKAFKINDKKIKVLN